MNMENLVTKKLRTYRVNDTDPKSPTVFEKSAHTEISPCKENNYYISDVLSEITEKPPKSRDSFIAHHMVDHPLY